MNLILSGELIPDDYAELYRKYDYKAGFYCPGDVRDAIQRLQPGEELVLEVNSIGGFVDSAAEIYSMLETTQNPTRAVIQGLAASAASYMIQSCDVVEIHLPAQMMIHLAASGARGNKHAFERAYQMLDTSDRSILSVYVRKSAGKADEATLEQLMEKETYLTSTDALAYGLVDKVVGVEPQAGAPMVAASAFNNTVRAMRTLPDIQDLIARDASETAARFRQELEAEKSRYKNS